MKTRRPAVAFVIFSVMLFLSTSVYAKEYHNNEYNPSAKLREANSTACGSGPFNIDQAVTDRAQSTTIAFGGLALIAGNLQAQSFFPPGKLVDYWGFQYLRDNDPDNMGHNTSFLTRVSCNMLYILNDSQLASLKALASDQVAQINEYGYRRYPLMKAFRRLVDGDVPEGSTGLDPDAVKAASKELYELDGQISFDRAVMYASIFRSFSSSQKSYIDAMVGYGWNSWPDKDMDDVRDRMAGLSQDEAVAVMTYAGDMFSWYAGCVEADIYFCPERHGTYFGSFYIKDAPAIGHEGYSIDEQLTAMAGAALCDSSKGYVSAGQADLVNSLVETQRNNLYSGTLSIVQARTDISNALRQLISDTELTADQLAQIKEQVMEKSGEYGELDGENNYNYATVFAQLKASLSDSQMAALSQLRSSILTGTYSDGTPFDFTTCDTYYLFSAPVADISVLDQYIADTDYLFGGSVPPSFAISVVTKALDPFRLKIYGAGFQDGSAVLINGQTAPMTLYKSANMLVAKGAGLKAMLPKGVTVEITVQAPDGSISEPFSYTRQ
jgi:hypothetical protein